MCGNERIALALEGVAMRYGQARILHGVELRVERGEFHALIGPNGAGKSTLFNVVSGVAAPTAGRIRLHGRDITGLPAHKVVRRGLSRSFQVANVLAGMSVADNLRCAAMRACGVGYLRRRGLHAAHARADRLLAGLGLDTWALRLAGELGYAGQRTLELGMVLATDASVLLLDEPTAGMSRTEAARMSALLREACRGRTVLIVEHDMQVVFELADRISVMVRGEMIATGTPDRIRADPAVRRAYLGQAGEHAHG
ncbi:Lipopolysaccharide export system ATP-binding protein LptB [Pigmentiphaga humi]|uniref:Lipopolysaccharide export system ATP-binding protein LptB n=1 Tax=Pigmentiphaga humi TaxID=2478468 RepID=A0A3P4B6S8_9BURK|nr:ABC transporter ATP-binding protein [Pigmentiphaga humi]VCU72003.1 Lipopolysaccharide export system ATP-binding protein LptB [Pigmentiphaga humi]